METYLPTPIEAESAKLSANACRNIHFAIADQFYMTAASAGLDYTRLSAGMKFHSPRLDSLPGADLSAGPCLLKDTMQLDAFARNQFFLGAAAMNINEGLVMLLVDRRSARWDLKQKTIRILGVAVKPENDDICFSLGYKLKKSVRIHLQPRIDHQPLHAG